MIDKMKRIAILAALFALVFSACRDEVTILRKLTDNEASVIPYTMGQSFTFVNQDNDTVTLTVNADGIEEVDSYFPFDSDNNAKMTKPRIPDCYGRIVRLKDNDNGNVYLSLAALPDSILSLQFVRNTLNNEPADAYFFVLTDIDLKKNHADSITVDGRRYYDVIVNTQDNNYPYIIYSCTEGLMLLKTSNRMYVKEP